MLVLNRRARETIIIRPAAQASELPQQAFADLEINICVLSLGPSFARIGVDAPEWCEVLRAELTDNNNNNDV